MRPGTKPKTATQKRLAGNPGRRPLNDSEPTPAAKAPTMPKHLDAIGRREWKWLCKELRAMGTLASSDKALMTMYCDTWSQYVAVSEHQNKQRFPARWLAKSKDRQQLYITAFFNVESMLKKQLKQYISELGLSAPSRVSLRATSTGAEGPVGPLRVVGRDRSA